jgi:phosphoenolpyruvate carboxykinase (ATP)
LSVELNDSAFETDPLFGFKIPKECPGLPSEILNPRESVSDQKDYQERALKLAADFKDNFKQFEKEVPPGVLASIP